MLKKSIIKKCKKYTEKYGSALAETVLLIAISLVIIITIFYPTFKSIVNDTLISISDWFTNALNTLGV